MTAARPGSAGKGHDFLRAITAFGEANGTTSSADKPIKMGRVDYDYAATDFLGGVNPRILFDGESTVSQKRYPVIVGYYPLPGQRVALVPVGTTYLIIGTVDVTAPQDPDVQIFTATDTWEKPAGARMIRVQVQAGGGAGGGCVATPAGEACGGGGGAGGAYGESWISANVVGATETVTVGAGGTGGSGTGGNGTSSSFGSLVSATGGPGGGTTGSSANGAGVSGATAASETVVGDIAINGQGGGSGAQVAITGGVSIGGMGGSSHLGSGGRGVAARLATVSGTTGTGYGGGGGGAVSGSNNNTSSVNGGNGAPGVVIVTTYF